MLATRAPKKDIKEHFHGFMSKIDVGDNLKILLHQKFQLEISGGALGPRALVLACLLA